MGAFGSVASEFNVLYMPCIQGTGIENRIEGGWLGSGPSYGYGYGVYEDKGIGCSPRQTETSRSPGRSGDDFKTKRYL